jgi:hypothetical protein
MPDQEIFMTAPRDLLIVTMDMAITRPVHRGDLSLALAGAELVDLYRDRIILVADDRIVPGDSPVMVDRLLEDAASSIVRQEPYERVGDWLWRRGRGLADTYLAALEAEGQAVREQSRHLLVFHTSRLVLVDSADRRSAANRWAAREPVLATLAKGIGLPGEEDEELPRVDDTVATVLAAVDEALEELRLERQRRSRKRDAATADNVQRGY